MRTNFTEKWCFKCIHKAKTFTCPASMCKLKHKYPCYTCAANKYEGITDTRYGRNKWSDENLAKVPKRCPDFKIKKERK